MPKVRGNLSAEERALVYRMITCEEPFTIVPGTEEYTGPLTSLVNGNDITVLTPDMIAREVTVHVQPIPGLNAEQRRAAYFTCVGEIDPELPPINLAEALALAQKAFE
jgi:hypothetical protein